MILNKEERTMKKILLVTSFHTGAGHQSITEALTEQFAGMPDLEVRVIEGFDLMGWRGWMPARLYRFLTRISIAMYNALWRHSSAHRTAYSAVTKACDRRFTEIVRAYQPDLILTVHAVFNETLTRILRKHKLDIPLAVLQADLADLHCTWCNPGAAMTLCATPEAYDASVRQGVPPERLKVVGFPVRRRFIEAARETDGKGDEPSCPLHVLLISGAEGIGSLRAYARAILGNTDAALTVVCGRNRRICHRLRKSLGREYGDRAEVLGFVPDMEKVMLRSDLIVTRPSPNTLAEAVTMGIPVVMTGPVLEQERSNGRLAREHHLGVPCESPADAPRVIRGLLDNGAAEYREIRAAQRAFRRFDTTRDIAAFAAELAGVTDRAPG